MIIPRQVNPRNQVGVWTATCGLCWATPVSGKVKPTSIESKRLGLHKWRCRGLSGSTAYWPAIHATPETLSACGVVVSSNFHHCSICAVTHVASNLVNNFSRLQHVGSRRPEGRYSQIHCNAGNAGSMDTVIAGHGPTFNTSQSCFESRLPSPSILNRDDDCSILTILRSLLSVSCAQLHTRGQLHVDTPSHDRGSLLLCSELLAHLYYQKFSQRS